MINHRGHGEHGGMRLKLREFALVRDANGQLVEDNGGSGLKTAAKVGLGAAGVAGGAVLGTRGYHYYGAVKRAGKGSFREGVSNAATYNALRGDGAAEKVIGATAQASARKGWMGKLGKVGNVLTKFSANLKPALRELAARSEGLVELAMIRDASGQYIEVPADRGNGLKVGAGVVAAGALGYGAYKGHNAVVGKHESKLVDAGAEKYVNNTLNGSMPADFAKGAAKNDAAKMGSFAKVKGAYSNLAQEGVTATKGAASQGLGFLKKLNFLKKAGSVV